VLISDGSNILAAEAYVPVTRNGGRWERADYGTKYLALDTVDKSVNGQLRRLIRYIKAWRKHHSTLLKSIVMEVVATDFMSKWDREQTSLSEAVDTGVGWYMQAKESLQDATLACQYWSRRLHVLLLLAGGVRQ
jgi:hypothetical protein